MSNKHSLDTPIFIFGIVLLTITTAFSVDTSIPALPAIAESLQSTTSIAPLVVGYFLMGLTLGQIPAGICSDRYGRMPVLYVGLSIFIVGGILASTAETMDTLLLARLLQGLGSAAGPILGRAISRDISEGQRTVSLVSLMTSVLAVTTILSPLIGSALTSFGGWRLTLSVPTAWGVFTLIYCVIFISETNPGMDEKSSVIKQITQSVKGFFSEPKCVVSTLLLGLNFGAYFSLLSLSSPILSDVYGFSVGTIGLLFALIVIPYIIGSVLTGKLNKQSPKNNLLTYALTFQLIVSLIMFALLLIQPVPLWLLWVVCGVFMGNMGVIFPSTVAISMGPLPKSAGISSSIIGTFQIGVGAIFVYITSSFYTQDIVSLATCIGLTGIVSYLIFVKYKAHLT